MKALLSIPICPCRRLELPHLPQLRHRPPAVATAVGGPLGPTPPPSRSKPDWVRILEEDAKVDEEIAELLQDTDGDPDKIRAKMEKKLQSPFGSSPSSSSSSGTGVSGLFETRTGSDEPPHITFREVDVFNLWIWLELQVPPSAREQELLQSTVKSWFVVGKLGGYNSQNLQVYYNNSEDNSYLEYDSAEAGSSLTSYMHSCSDVEFKGSWARFHVDLGTADELAFDILLNTLVGFSHEVAGISRIMVGGEHERWEIPAVGTEEDEEDSWMEDGRPRKQHGEAPKVGINPMKLPQGIEEELEMLDELGGLYDQQQQQQQPQQQQQQPVQPSPQRQWGRGLKPLGGPPRRGSLLQQQQQVGNGSNSSSSKSSGSLKQQDLPPGMTMYSEEDFKRIFGGAEDD